MQRVLLILLVLGLSLALVGCMHSDPALPLTQDMRGVSAALNLRPYPPVQMEEANLQLILKDQSNQPVTGATVQFDLSKLDMSMPPYFLKANDDGNGIYQVQGFFYMPGDWQIRVDVFIGAAHRQFIYHLEVN
jgi:hypothetical protein